MTAKQSGALRTGRATRVREYLAKLPRGQHRTARQIADAVEPGGDVNHMSATLGTLVRGGHLVRIDTGRHRAAYAIHPRPAPVRKARPAPPARPVPRSSAPATPPRGRGNGSQTGIRKALRNLAGSGPDTSKRTVAATTAGARRAQLTHVHAAPGTTQSESRAHSAARQRLAADIATFQRTGGAIERLGTTITLTRINHRDDK